IVEGFDGATICGLDIHNEEGVIGGVSRVKNLALKLFHGDGLDIKESWKALFGSAATATEATRFASSKNLALSGAEDRIINQGLDVVLVPTQSHESGGAKTTLAL